MKPPSNVKTPAQYIASLAADRAQTIATVRALVNKHIPRGYDECLVWGTIGAPHRRVRWPPSASPQSIGSRLSRAWLTDTGATRPTQDFFAIDD